MRDIEELQSLLPDPTASAKDGGLIVALILEGDLFVDSISKLGWQVEDLTPRLLICDGVLGLCTV